MSSVKGSRKMSQTKNCFKTDPNSRRYLAVVNLVHKHIARHMIIAVLYLAHGHKPEGRLAEA